MMKQVIVKTYKGSQSAAAAEFSRDSQKMAEKGYFPTSQSWAPGAYGCGSFLVALILCVVLIGILIFIYMLIVKPPGTLSVTYELRESLPKDSWGMPIKPPAPPKRNYYCYIDDKVQGPYDLESLKKMRLSSKISEETSCCLEGTEIWITYKDIQF